jgi:hypothetical protein
MTAIEFSCRQCGMHFKVPESFAGKGAHCKKCGQKLQVPRLMAAAASVAATGVFRLGNVEPSAQRPSPQTGPPESGMPRRSAATDSLRLASIPSLDNLQPIKPKHERLWEDDDGVEYELEKPADAPAPKLPRQYRQQGGGLFWGRGGIAEVALIWLRKLSDYAYLVSLPLLLAMLLAIVFKQRELAVFAAVVVILLNLARFAVDGFVLVTLAFKNSPVEGVLFFIPPFTFYYLNKRGRVMKEAFSRFLAPAVPILGVILLFIFVPWLRGSEPAQAESVRERLRSNLGEVRENILNKTRSPDSSNK